MRRILGMVAVAALALGGLGGFDGAAVPAGAVTGVHYSYSPTSGPVGTVIDFTATGCAAQSSPEDGLFTLETNPANPSGEQWSAIFKSGVPGHLTVPAFVAPGSYKVQAQCVANGFDPTYSPCGFTVTSTPGTAGACDSTTGPVGNPGVGIGNAAVVEGSAGTRVARFSVSLSKASASAVSVSYATTAGTATAGTDFVAKSGTVTIPAGSTSAAVTVSVKGDVAVEPNETFTVKLSAPTGAVIARRTGTGTILNDDPTTGLRVAIGNAAAVEGNTGTRPARFSVSLSKASTSPVSVSYTTTAGTATAGTDFVAKSGIVTIPAGSTGAAVNISVKGDATNEPNETFTVKLSAPSGASLGRATGTGTVVDDD